MRLSKSARSTQGYRVYVFLGGFSRSAVRCFISSVDSAIGFDVRVLRHVGVGASVCCLSTNCTSSAGGEGHESETFTSLVSALLYKKKAGFFHVNVYDSGGVCLSILGDAWKPSIAVKQVLVGIQELLDDPNPNSAAQHRCYELYKKNMPEYKKRVREQAKTLC